jgi:hypothetical protein
LPGKDQGYDEEATWALLERRRRNGLLRLRHPCGGDDLLVRAGAGFRACVEATVAKAGVGLGAPMVTAAIAERVHQRLVQR